MTSDVGPSFGELLRRLRRAAGLTMEELADLAGLSARGIADLERGVRRTPRRDTVALLARALGISPDDEAALLSAGRYRSLGTALATRAKTADMTGQSPAASLDAPSRIPPNNLPAQSTRLLGRQETVRAVAALMRRSDVRMVTLTGPGGVGKTRLAIAVAVELLDDFVDGVSFVRLSRLVDPALVLPTVAETLGVKPAESQSIAETLRDYLREKRLALVLDNCEHVAAAAGEVAMLLEACPALAVLATSRMALRLRAEHEYPVPPLAVPPTTEQGVTAHLGSVSVQPDLTQYSAAVLFLERARAVQPDFALTDTNAPAVAAICARLDGLPLAIELAAARVKVLPPNALLDRLTTRADVLRRGTRDVEARQQTMRNTLAWSYELLEPEERRLFYRLGVFVGGCTLDAVEAVCVAPEGVARLQFDLLDGLSALIDHSLVQRHEDEGVLRFGLLNVIREYALDQLEASGEGDALRRAHAISVLALVERAEPELTGPRAAEWLGRLEQEHDNLRAALRWARERGEEELGLRLVAAVFRFWMVRGHLQEGRLWVEELLALGSDAADPNGGDTEGPEPEASSGIGRRVRPGVRARACRAAGVLALYQRDESAADQWLEQAAQLARADGDLRTAANALSSRGVSALHQGNLQQAGAYLEESLRLMREVGERRDIAVVQTNLGVVHYNRDDLERATLSFAEALAIARKLSDRDLEGTSLANLAAVAMRQGNVARAEAQGREALSLYNALGDPRRCAVGLEGLASSAAMSGRGIHAARLLGAATALREALGTPLTLSEQVDVERLVAPARAALGEERWAAAFAEGRALTLVQAVAEALGEADSGAGARQGETLASVETSHRQSPAATPGSSAGCNK